MLGSTDELAAEGQRGGLEADSDGDGLTDAQELVLQSDPFHKDTDRDGYSDAEELARGSAGFVSNDTPLPTDLDMALSARGEEDGLHVVVAAYFTDGTIDNKQLAFGALIHDDVMVEVSPGQLMHDPRMSVSPSLDGLGQVMVIDFEMPTLAIFQLGHVSLYATMSIDGQGYVAAAAVIDFFVTPDGVLMQSSPSHGTFGALRGGGGNGFYQPIPPGGGDLPIGWVPGRICQQTTEPVGYAGGIVTTRVTEAKCVDGWDSHCNAGECKGSVGDEYTTIDPLGLVGG